MPYADPTVQRAYQRSWAADRRTAFMDSRCCVDCGSTDRLEIDHVDGEKVDHKVWSWRTVRREAELAKCVVRCRACHQERHAVERRRHGIGGYQRRKCRCEVCCAAKAAANVRQKRGRKSNPGNGLCRPAHSHSATAPGDVQLTLFEAAR